MIEDLCLELLAKNNFAKLMMHPIANFLCQALIHNSQVTTLEKILFSIKADFAKLAMDKHGTRAL